MAFKNLILLYPLVQITQCRILRVSFFLSHYDQGLTKLMIWFLWCYNDILMDDIRTKSDPKSLT